VDRRGVGNCGFRVRNFRPVRVDTGDPHHLSWSRPLPDIGGIAALTGSSHPGRRLRPFTLARGDGSTERKRYVAKQTTVVLVDDLDGSEAAEQVEFAVDGRSYHIDLSAANSAKLREALAPYIAAARRAGGRRSSGGGSGATPAPSRSAADRAQNQKVREWAIEQGMKISERGRIPSNVIEAYRQSH
jgi:hypothetical protein